MSWKDKVEPIKVGEKVAYSKAFLQSTGSYAGDIPHARGVVTKLVPLGEATLAEIEWDKPDLPKRVHVANLTVVRRLGLE